MSTRVAQTQYHTISTDDNNDTSLTQEWSLQTAPCQRGCSLQQVVLSFAALNLKSNALHPGIPKVIYHTFAEYGVANNVFKMMNGLIKVKVVQKKCEFHLIFILSSWLCMELVHDCCEQNGPTVPSERWEQWD